MTPSGSNRPKECRPIRPQGHKPPWPRPQMGASHLLARKPSCGNDQCLAPTGEVESHRARLREAFGNTLSDEFVEVLLGKFMELLRPNPFDKLRWR